MNGRVRRSPVAEPYASDVAVHVLAVKVRYYCNTNSDQCVCGPPPYVIRYLIYTYGIRALILHPRVFSSGCLTPVPPSAVLTLAPWCLVLLALSPSEEAERRRRLGYVSELVS